jgi:hypothetical protein
MADFKTAFLFTLQHEDSTRSGKVIVDAGGRTRFGIAEKFHPDLSEEFFTGPAEDALTEAEKIEGSEYWDCMRLAEVENQNVANKLFDMGVNMGVRQAAINAIDPQRFYGLLCEFSAWHYRHIAANNPAQAVNLAGWMNRASA